MGILEVITVVFLVLKLTMYPEWSWLFVASPLLIAIALYLVIGFLFVIGAVTLSNKSKKRR